MNDPQIQTFRQMFRLLEVGRYFMDFSIVHTLIAKLELRPREISVMMRLYALTLDSPQGIKAHELTQHMKLSQPATSMLIKGLMERGYISSNESPTDRRVRLLTISDSVRGDFDTMAKMQGADTQKKMEILPVEARARIESFIDEMHSYLIGSGAKE